MPLSILRTDRDEQTSYEIIGEEPSSYGPGALEWDMWRAIRHISEGHPGKMLLIRVAPTVEYERDFATKIEKYKGYSRLVVVEYQPPALHLPE